MNSSSISATSPTSTQSNSTAQSDFSTRSDSSTQSATITRTSQSIPSLTSSRFTSSTKDVNGLISSFWEHEPTVTPNANDGVHGHLFCTDELLLGCKLPTGFLIEKLVTATEVEIPEVTDVSVFPNINVNGVDVVKMNLPEDKCKPIPKPSGGGVVGAVVQVASDVVNTVVDAACNVEFPIIKENLPDWFNFGSFPNPTSFLPPPGVNLEEPQTPEPSKTPKLTEASSCSRSSCSQTAYSSCDLSRFVWETMTLTFQSCTTTTACSGADITKVTAIAKTCSQTEIQDCQGTALATGGGTTFFTTDCSARSACSGTGITLATTITASTPLPDLTIYTNPLEEEGWMTEQQCVISKIAYATTEVQEANISACYGETIASTLNSTPTDTFAATTPDFSSTITDEGSGPSDSSFDIATKSRAGSSSEPSASSSTTMAPSEATTGPSQTYLASAPSPMDYCKTKDGKCFCRPDSCFSTSDLAFDCYTVEAANCDEDCNGCEYPSTGTC